MTGNMLAEYNTKIAWVHCKRAQIEYLVMKCTKGQSVVLDIRPARLEPLDMRSFQPDSLLPQAQVVAADATPILIGAQYALAKLGITVSGLVFSTR
ncbi:hypothetical protein ABW22_10455 [Thiobacillus denitrificans]|uniref:Uncharacterized protein n=1 Tax=Thiobacillus denitrificans TaxID=36861 RepID=A0A106BN81_THIDE|nr:hypothetical protein ABW22_10455 [Thiobacillus denitrificans]